MIVLPLSERPEGQAQKGSGWKARAFFSIWTLEITPYYIYKGEKGHLIIPHFQHFFVILHPNNKNILANMEQKNFKRTTVTAALPYANGGVHIGHLAGVYLRTLSSP